MISNKIHLIGPTIALRLKIQFEKWAVIKFVQCMQIAEFRNIGEFGFYLTGTEIQYQMFV